MTQSELAEKLNIPYQSIGQWERDVRKPKLETINRIAAALNTQPSSLLSQESNPISPELQHAFLRILQERIESQLIVADPVDVSEATGAAYPYADVLEGQGTLTLGRLEEIADELGVPLEYLISGKSDPADHYPFVSDELQHRLDTADARLLDTVHRICGINPKKHFSEKSWNPERIDLVREYLKDSQAILKKMIATIESPSGTDGK